MNVRTRTRAHARARALPYGQGQVELEPDNLRMICMDARPLGHWSEDHLDDNYHCGWHLSRLLSLLEDFDKMSYVRQLCQTFWAKIQASRPEEIWCNVVCIHNLRSLYA